MTNKIKSLIICGGSGTRLWPLSRESFPKQFVPLINNESLLGLTIKRAMRFGDVYGLTNEDYRFYVRDLFDSLTKNQSGLHENIMLESSLKNTAPAIAASLFMPGISDDDLLLFLPSDHFIPEVDSFYNLVTRSAEIAKSGYIVTFGVKPNYPSTSYGYIKKGALLPKVDQLDSYIVDSFTEKPNLDLAVSFLLSDNYFWNAGIFLAKKSTLVEAFKDCAPDIFEACFRAMKSFEVDGSFVRPNKSFFSQSRTESFDYAVMEKFNKVAMVPFVGPWSDVGSWTALAQMSPEDDFGNSMMGRGAMINVKNTYINASYRPVVAIDLSDMIIVETIDAILVSSKKGVESVKDAVAQLNELKIEQGFLHRKVMRPWGSYDTIDIGETFKVKRILVNPKASLSLQKHAHRSEHWVVVRGTAEITLDSREQLLFENESVYIPIGSVHRLKNPTDDILEIIEVQTGKYLGEDDIVRYEDVYGRTS